MKEGKQIADFIQMRIEGKSFDEIAKELNTAKSTLIDWNKKACVKTLIDEGKAFAINNVVKAFQYDRQARLKTMLEISKKINDELKSRDLADISTDKLLQMSIANDGRIMKMIDTRLEIGENESVVSWDNGDGFFQFRLDE
jgi:predicted XRE-type DNA-binding protein